MCRRCQYVGSIHFVFVQFCNTEFRSQKDVLVVSVSSVRRQYRKIRCTHIPYYGTLAIHRTTYYNCSTYYDRTTMNGQSSIVIWSYIFAVYSPKNTPIPYLMQIWLTWIQFMQISLYNYSNGSQSSFDTHHEICVKI